ncbi:ABC-three component system protein [Actinosynnema sp. NPDC050801]|uniref:ABC-three component system protein n=1 Tax=unclassified Actinosynnema TaxID=2637065 RepID=UPI0033DE76EA
MSYAYEDLDDAQFERLVVECARKLCGMAVQSFATGVDGGRDARFEGTAERFPSTAEPWTGLTIIQAKHTNGTNVHYSDSGFSGRNDSSTLTEEIGRIKKLVAVNEVDNYALFANRRLGAVSHEEIKKRIVADTGLESKRVFLAGTEYLDTLLHMFPDVTVLARIDPIDGPLLVSSSDLAEVILAIAREFDLPLLDADAPVVDRVSYVEKNALNNMSPSFAKTLSDRYLPYTAQIDKFLAHPANVAVRELYDSAVEDFQLKVIAHRAEFQSFDKVFNYLVDLLVKRDVVLSRHRRLLRVMLFYMYWHCDIGETQDASTQ